MLSNQVIEVGKSRWLVRQAASEADAMQAIAYARADGSIGGKITVDDTACGGSVVVAADVVRLNADGTECKPYSFA